jgi:hypothetical protein
VAQGSTRMGVAAAGPHTEGQHTRAYMAGTPSFLCATNHGVGGAMPCSTCASRYKSALRTSTSLYPPRSTRRGGAASDGSSAAIDM